MNRKMVFSVRFVFMFMMVSFWVSAQEVKNCPVAISPGSNKELVSVWQSCPTFSWSAVNQASSYRIAVFEVFDSNVTEYEGMEAMSSPKIITDIPGPALSWTLSSEKSLKTGSMYAWYVRAIDAYGNPLGSWSDGKIFKVVQQVNFAGIEERLARKLRDYGMDEDTINNMLGEMKSDVKGFVDQGDESNNLAIYTAGQIGVQGYEGTTNTFYGQFAGNSITSGFNNTFIGTHAGFSTTSGYANSFFGQSAGYSNTIGHSNTFLGNETGIDNTEGYANTFIGRGAGSSNTTGNSNTFLGFYAGACNITGNYNTLMGYAAGNSNSSGSSNTFIGHEAGKHNTVGGYNVLIGHEAGQANTSGKNNTFIGYGAGKANTTGYQNIFVGNYAGLFHTTGNDNTFFGHWAGQYNTTGVCNVFFGNGAGHHNTTGSCNIFLGYEAGYTNTTGVSNITLGYSAGFSNTTGNDNTFFGNFAGKNNTTGNNNTFLGNEAGYLNASGQGNVFLGYKAGFNETGSNKLYIANSDTISPLIYGEFDNNSVKINGNFRVTGNFSLDNGVTQINSNEINLLDGKTGFVTGSANNDKLVTQGYVDDHSGGGLTGNSMTDKYICKWDDINTKLVNSLISENGGIVGINGSLSLNNNALSLDNGTHWINEAEMNILDGKILVTGGVSDNDKLVTKGYVDTFDDVGGGLTGADMTNQYICKWDDSGTKLVNSIISENPGALSINGKIGVGTISPTDMIHIETTGSNSTLKFDRTDGATVQFAAKGAQGILNVETNHPLKFGTNNTTRMIIAADGKVGIGIAPTIYPLEMAGGAYCTGETWQSVSSRKFKENIENLTTNVALDTLSQLNPVIFNYKRNKDEKYVGFISEDVPELVTTNRRDAMNAMDVVAVLTKVVQEQQRLLLKHQETISDLQKRITNMKNK